MKIAVIGAGKWGQALYSALKINNDCVISSRTKRDIDGFIGLSEALKYDYLLFSISTQMTDEFLSLNFKSNNQKILVASKGIDIISGKFLHEIYAKFSSGDNLAFLSGPSFASEVMQGLPCALVISSQNKELAQIWASAFPNFIKPYISSDVIGAEICGAYKNVIAIAGGVCAGLGLGQNARASLISRGLVEMARFGEHFGAKSDTFLGLSGAGDLFLSASSELSRNYRVGLGLAKGENLDRILDEIGEVAEGVATARAITKMAQQRVIYTPIANQVVDMLGGKNAKEALKDLLKRQ
ncbi:MULTISPECIES: NAD(P)H-dependent glycerol-3-phosphate dehydrogenase [Campylobacter]|uniref:Glycerol-3-phosphate dehydrogenase [NAD(P)+] n=1 Tax=Campylobacter porcelli TaxID=1660073 RepID=A0ABU7M3T3_9BACT|nr:MULTISPECIES: NAD(P)H-dependent glycerol-3-phosphate dehydrogenase [unclassified Campylobacter]MCR8678341.1 NAD(P)H-dependent glycerol-3-phosphate dehydrogenase [Campylobacter sp. RM19072]MCR8695692.1 NAD(P)H-dependent glycerol-3-phosphate dehydrogenase [Campylobacter sp. RM19073]MEE3704306.1 NAD(P)H-dependent glycerol-3-phosphate dehydrogenase [Campylobacter sp. CX2-8023-23]MEE3743953.1 NAD(P)H-dependent glycerol-3-phosphate dehydrogenase [Campylobacter sp. CX2-4855-23]MEE3776211.1 NAD(P)H